LPVHATRLVDHLNLELRRFLFVFAEPGQVSCQRKDATYFDWFLGPGRARAKQAKEDGKNKT